MFYSNKVRRLKALWFLPVSLFMLSACGDSSVANNAKDIQEGAAATNTVSELVSSADNVKAGSGRVSAAQLVLANDIHWSHQLYFPEHTFEGKVGFEALSMGMLKLEKLAANQSIERQIKECHSHTKEGQITGTGYKFENNPLMRVFDERFVDRTNRIGQSLDNDLALYYMRLVKQHSKMLSSDERQAVSEAFWQWCIALPNTYWTGSYQNNPISL